MHVTALLKQNKLAEERKVIEECARMQKKVTKLRLPTAYFQHTPSVRVLKRIQENAQDEATSARSKLLEARRQSRIRDVSTGQFVKFGFHFGPTTRWLLSALDPAKLMRDRLLSLGPAGRDFATFELALHTNQTICAPCIN